MSTEAESPEPARLSRRGLLKGGLMLGGAVGGALIATGGAVAAQTLNAPARATEPFWGEHQSGITTGTQRQTVLAAFDLNTSSRDDLIAILKGWTELAGNLTSGASSAVPRVEAKGSRDAYADTTGHVSTDDSLEAWQLGPQRLTVTVGVGAGVFEKDGKDRFGLASRRPGPLVELPRFPGDALVAAQSDGDLFVQACADDPQVAFHAVRSLARVAPDVATLRWTQLGFSPDDTGGTPRNLMGFKDGTINSNVHPPEDLAATVWADEKSPRWLRGGSYLVYRRIRITLEHWDRLPLASQEQVIGRAKVSGAPLGRAHEFDALDLTRSTSEGTPAIPVDAHVRLAAPQTNDGAVILRRAFSYNNGTTPFVERWPPWRQAIEYDSGLLFLAYQSDPRTAFIPINTRLAASDALNQFTTHTASGVFAILPGATRPGDWLGRTLLT